MNRSCLVAGIAGLILAASAALAGEPEARCRRQRLEEGIPLTAETLKVLQEYGFSGGRTRC